MFSSSSCSATTGRVCLSSLLALFCTRVTVDDAAESDGATWCWGIFFENDDKKVLFMAANQGRMEAQVLELHY
ncbi:hypothetical protein EDD18DRAFT_1144185 [Armillaria luteobubalina]|uniref:Secreted protein n=1 Tax=Armillaria luteobubalina TaxID=153913 RepID=A0AA39UXD1_9AGAR|nr:hypothetical protein EDD18DRAFT_1144185 [Armillaria luteobubalina]